MPSEPQKDILDEILHLLSEEERSQREKSEAGENTGPSPRARRLDQLLNEILRR